jgi:hypothetical protein
MDDENIAGYRDIFCLLENGTTFGFIPTSEEAYQNYYMQMLKTKQSHTTNQLSL